MTTRKVMQFSEVIDKVMQFSEVIDKIMQFSEVIDLGLFWVSWFGAFGVTLSGAEVPNLGPLTN